MLRFPWFTLVLGVFLASCAAPDPGAVPPKSRNTDAVASPITHPDGRPFRVAVVQSGDYFAYNDVLVSLRNGLADLGWTSSVSLGSDEKASIPLILKAWEAREAGSSVVFPPAAFVDLNWTEDPHPPTALVDLLAGKAGVDLVVSLGTLAGTFVAREARSGSLRVPVMVESVSDPVGAGIIASIADSGADLVTASFDPGAYDRQVRFFHRVIGFRRLGLIYTDTPTGRSYAAWDTVNRAAADLGFTVVGATDVLEDPPDPKDLPRAEAAYLRAFEDLAPRVDAVYLAVQAGLTASSLPSVVAAAERHRIPTFVMEGADFVWRGALLGESNTLQTVEGLYSARKLTRILTGARPRDLPQANPHVPHIALNLAEARRIGWDPPVDVLLGADEVFTSFLSDSREVRP